jgi:hypothetical protein
VRVVGGGGGGAGGRLASEACVPKFTQQLLQHHPMPLTGEQVPVKPHVRSDLHVAVTLPVYPGALQLMGCTAFGSRKH